MLDEWTVEQTYMKSGINREYRVEYSVSDETVSHIYRGSRLTPFPRPQQYLDFRVYNVRGTNRAECRGRFRRLFMFFWRFESAEFSIGGNVACVILRAGNQLRLKIGEDSDELAIGSEVISSRFGIHEIGFARRHGIKGLIWGGLATFGFDKTFFDPLLAVCLAYFFELWQSEY